jgi:type VI secretion system Hcp family effector
MTLFHRSATVVLFGILLVTCLGPATEARADDIFLELVGDKGAISSLSGTILVGHATETEILSLAGNVYVEDLAAMTLSQRPLRVQKAQDPSSPRLLEALTTFEEITTCVIRFYTSPGGGGQLVFQIDFTNPVLVGLTASAQQGNQVTEVLSIGYDSITYTSTPVP